MAHFVSLFTGLHYSGSDELPAKRLIVLAILFISILVGCEKYNDESSLFVADCSLPDDYPILSTANTLTPLPDLHDLHSVAVDGYSVNIKPYQMHYHREFLDSAESRLPSYEEMIELSRTYSEAGSDESFSPYLWDVDVGRICRYIETHGSNEESLAILRATVDFMAGHIWTQNGVSLVEYPFSHTVCKTSFDPPWHSAFGNGKVMRGLTAAYECTGEERYIQLAGQLVEAFLHPRDDPSRTFPWITFVDSEGYFWFEEYPQDQHPSFRVLNGHISALQNLYYYYL